MLPLHESAVVTVAVVVEKFPFGQVVRFVEITFKLVSVLVHQGALLTNTFHPGAFKGAALVFLAVRHDTLAMAFALLEGPGVDVTAVSVLQFAVRHGVVGEGAAEHQIRARPELQHARSLPLPFLPAPVVVLAVPGRVRQLAFPVEFVLRKATRVLTKLGRQRAVAVVLVVLPVSNVDIARGVRHGAFAALAVDKFTIKLVAGFAVLQQALAVHLAIFPLPRVDIPVGLDGVVEPVLDVLVRHRRSLVSTAPFFLFRKLFSDLVFLFCFRSCFRFRLRLRLRLRLRFRSRGWASNRLLLFQLRFLGRFRKAEKVIVTRHALLALRSCSRRSSSRGK
mmetsp:Transcript_9524/g.18053  ORF Transcript_9524/g.18053 Transcript_9524/m.18053 type:complete len:336 (-) Transcript_9524:190-1197(-)